MKGEHPHSLLPSSTLVNFLITVLKNVAQRAILYNSIEHHSTLSFDEACFCCE